MHTAELITRYLSLKTMPLSSSGRGGIPSLTQADVLAAVGAIPSRAAQALLLVKFTGHDDHIPTLLECLAPAVLEMAQSQGWPDDPARIAGIVRGAVSEYIQPQVCRSCQGGGEVYQVGRRAYAVTGGEDYRAKRLKWPEGLLQPCGRCNGVGTRTPSLRARARDSGISRMTFQRGWAGRYAAVMELLAQLQREGLRVVSGRLG